MKSLGRQHFRHPVGFFIVGVTINIANFYRAGLIPAQQEIQVVTVDTEYGCICSDPGADLPGLHG